MTTSYYRFGGLPEAIADSFDEPLRRSFNYRDDRYESGVSVYCGTIEGDTLTLDLRAVSVFSALPIIGERGARGLVEVTGTLIRTGDTRSIWTGYDIEEVELSTLGADGEPLMRGDLPIECSPVRASRVVVLLSDDSDPIEL